MEAINDGASFEAWTWTDAGSTADMASQRRRWCCTGANRHNENRICSGWWGSPTPPFHEASPLSDESPVLNGGGPIRPVEQDVLKTWRDHPAFALRTAQPKIVEAASTPPAKIWREHPAFALRAAQPRSAIVDTINQPSEIVDLAPPATRPPRGLHLPQSTSGKVATRPPFSINHSAPPKPADELTRER